MPRQFLRSIEAWIDKFLERFIAAFEDSQTGYRNILVSEYALFFWGFGFFLWLLCFDVGAASPATRYMFSEILWTLYFGALSAAHIVSVVQARHRLRLIVLKTNIAGWLCWSIIALTSQAGSPACVFFFITACLSAVIAVKASRAEADIDRSMIKEAEQIIAGL